VKLIITIDTEEDTWRSYNHNSYTLHNVKQLPRLQELFNKFSVKPTYLINYPVATDSAAKSILKEIAQTGLCEIGTHCHPWNTPPFSEQRNIRNTMLCNLPPELQYQKLSSLHNTIKNNFHLEPKSFRAGRFGYNSTVAGSLNELAYTVDTSVTPYINWRNHFGPDFSNSPATPTIIRSSNPTAISSNNILLEVPVSTGFLHNNLALANKIFKILNTRIMTVSRLKAILNIAGLFKQVWLSPETNTAKEMIQLTKILLKNGISYLNMIFHSSSLIPGNSPYVKTKQDLDIFYRKIEQYLSFVADYQMLSLTLTETYNIFLQEQSDPNLHLK